MKSSLGKLGGILIGLAIFTYAEVWGEDWKFFENFTYKCSLQDSLEGQRLRMEMCMIK